MTLLAKGIYFMMFTQKSPVVLRYMEVTNERY